MTAYLVFECAFIEPKRTGKIHMRLFTIVVYIFAAIALVTGASDLVQGLASQKSFGASMPEQGVAIVDNVFRFFSAIWLGVGVLFVLFIRDLARYKPAMIALLFVVVLGGVGRIISIVQYGLPDQPAASGLVLAGLIAELLVTPILLWWLLCRHHSVPAH
ncbi:MAG: DUF4345 domain-containing protein [Granulosicoccus sp.]|nr:DUF4345 domain-containing protein [Granulosicoccus sp.]